MFKINPLVYIFIVIMFLTGSFKEFIIIYSLIIIHECGHILFSYLFKLKIKHIYLYPLGGISVVESNLNIHPIKELIILMMGPIFQQIAYLLLSVLFPYYIKIIKVYHSGILLFNLLPIYPLDGGKIVNVLLQKIFPYKVSYKIVIILSYFITFTIFFMSNKTYINNYIFIILLVLIITKEKNKIYYIYNKFLLERYLNNYIFKKTNIIKNENNFFRNRKHILNINNKYELEKDYLRRKYKCF